ncbi:MAG: TolC family protein [Marinoscillum sp.]|uniref:TolC family protein n=1 Tax=Marinoscillum sp. TaxID=2024838 RepID=UPI0032FDC761
MKLTKRLNQTIKPGLLSLMLILSTTVESQPVSVFSCYAMAEDLSPLKRKETYLNSINDLNQLIENTRNLPSVTLEASASYQSDVFGLPVNIPGVDFPAIPRDQYNMSLKVNQKIFDGGVSKASKIIEALDEQVKQNELDVSLYQIRNIINELYFGSLRLHQQEAVLISLLAEFENKTKAARAAFANGILLKSELNELAKEQLKVSQQLVQVSHAKAATLSILSTWINREISAEQLELPAPVENKNLDTIDRPELSLFTSRNEKLSAMAHLTSTKNIPRLYGFANVGYAQPNPLNFYETDWNGYYIVGARLTWGLDWGASKNQKEILLITQEMTLAEQENFLRQINNDLLKKQSEIAQMEATIALDEQILQMQNEIVTEAEKQYENGTRSSTDLLSILHEQAQLKMNLSIHSIALAQMNVELLTISGNLP